MAAVRYRYNTLDDFIVSHPLTVDGSFDDGWGAAVALKGREIEAVILFADISSFSERTLKLSPTETLAFVNTFFAWITAEALRTAPAIVDKYIGDEIMVICSQEFGSEDAFADAIKIARRIGENDFLDFRPHIGIAAGLVTVGYVGTPVKYSCSVFGAPVALAARCSAAKSGEAASASIVFPANLLAGRSIDSLCPARDGLPSAWKMLEPRKVKLKGVGEHELIEIANVTSHYIMSADGSSSVEDIVRENVEALKQTGRYIPRRAESSS